MQSILWCAWPPPERNMTLKIACGSNIDDIRGNTTGHLLFYIYYQLMQELRCNPSYGVLGLHREEVRR